MTSLAVGPGGPQTDAAPSQLMPSARGRTGKSSGRAEPTAAGFAMLVDGQEKSVAGAVSAPARQSRGQAAGRNGAVPEDAGSPIAAIAAAAPALPASAPATVPATAAVGMIRTDEPVSAERAPDARCNQPGRDQAVAATLPEPEPIGGPRESAGSAAGHGARSPVPIVAGAPTMAAARGRAEAVPTPFKPEARTQLAADQAVPPPTPTPAVVMVAGPHMATLRAPGDDAVRLPAADSVPSVKALRVAGVSTGTANLPSPGSGGPATLVNVPFSFHDNSPVGGQPTAPDSGGAAASGSGNVPADPAQVTENFADIAIGLEAGQGLEVRLSAIDAEAVGRLDGQVDRLAQELRAIGSDVEAIRVELRGTVGADAVAAAAARHGEADLVGEREMPKAAGDGGHGLGAQAHGQAGDTAGRERAARRARLQPASVSGVGPEGGMDGGTNGKVDLYG